MYVLFNTNGTVLNDKNGRALQSQPLHALPQFGIQQQIGNGCATSYRGEVQRRQLDRPEVHPDPAVRKRVFEAMMKMRKIDIAALKQAQAA